MTLAPFPYFGGKSRVAEMVWARLGNVENYVEPFFGSGAVLLSRPRVGKIESVNDADRFICNFWRSVQHDPEGVAHYLDWPVNECDLSARHGWLLNEGVRRIGACEGDPEFFDTQVAGWWCWGACSWIGAGWCSGEGPWVWDDGAGDWVNRKRPHLGNAGMGINRQLPHLGDAGRGNAILAWIETLAERLRHVRVCCGDWSRVCGPTVTHRHGMTGVFLDPPYADTAGRTEGLYATDSLTVAHEAREWAIAEARNPLMRIVFAGYEGEHQFPGWDCVEWKAHGGYGSQGEGVGRDNAVRERLWFSPACLPRIQHDLFSAALVADWSGADTPLFAAEAAD